MLPKLLFPVVWIHVRSQTVCVCSPTLKINQSQLWLHWVFLKIICCTLDGWQIFFPACVSCNVCLKVFIICLIDSCLNCGSFQTWKPDVGHMPRAVWTKNKSRMCLGLFSYASVEKLPRCQVLMFFPFLWTVTTQWFFSLSMYFLLFN